MEKHSRQHFDDVTLLITHFNRSESLRRLLETLSKCKVSFSEIIVSDGGSRIEHLGRVVEMQKELSFTLLTTETNKGLGNSINVGQDAARTPYILYIQEDFVPKFALIEAIKNGLAIMQQDNSWDIVRFYAFPWAPFPYLKPYKQGFSELIFTLAPWYLNHNKFYAYSDHPHLKRRSFPEKFGRYVETLNGDVTEMSMCRSFLKNGGKALYFTDFKSLFEHSNSNLEPGLIRPQNKKNKRYADIAPLYWVYLKYKVLKETFRYITNT